MTDQPSEIIPPTKKLIKTAERLAEEMIEAREEEEEVLNGRPPHRPTDATRTAVSLLIAFKFPQWKICTYLGIRDERTLRKYYSHEIEHGDMKIKAMVIGAWAKNVQDGKEATILRYMESEIMRPDLPAVTADHELKALTNERVQGMIKQIREEV